MSELSFTEFTDADDVDALHILPLRMIPLKNARLRRAKIVKNARLDGVVEIFSDRTTGSGEIDPISIMNALSFTEDEMSDVEIVQRLALLPSYDVYSLRIGPCLSGYHPHPLYVVCLLGLQARAGAGALRRRSG